MIRLIALGGEPATGKTSLMRAFLGARASWKPFQYGLLRGSRAGNVFVLGLYDPSETFAGTDRLSMAVQPHAVKFLAALKAENFGAVVVFEGDRLFNSSFISAAKAVCDVRLLLLEVSEDAKKKRHAFRGDSQTESWLKGRKTKLENVLKAAPSVERLPNENEFDQARALARLLELAS